MLQANVSRLGFPPSPEALEDRPELLAKGDRVSDLKSKLGAFV